MVVVMHELREQRTKMTLADHDHVVQALLAKGPQHTLGDRVRAWCTG